MTKYPLVVIERYDSGKEFSKCWVVDSSIHFVYSE